jgi:hypothetical protein
MSSLRPLLLCLGLLACADGPKGKPAKAEAVCEKMETCDFRYGSDDECEDELLEDGKGGEACRDRDAYLRCIRPCLDEACSEFEYCEFDCYADWCQ